MLLGAVTVMLWIKRNQHDTKIGELLVWERFEYPQSEKHANCRANKVSDQNHRCFGVDKRREKEPKENTYDNSGA